MAGLQRSTTSFRRQGSSGLIWDDKLISGELNQGSNPGEEGEKQQQQSRPEQKDSKNPDSSTTAAAGSSREGLDRSRSSGGGRGLRAVKVSPAAIDPPSPRLSGCGFCSPFKKPETCRRTRTAAGPGKRRSR